MTKRSKRRDVVLGLIASTLTIALIFGAAEVALRIAIFSDTLEISSLRQAWRYADSRREDDYWKLVYLFGADRNAIAAGNVHPRYGWAPESTAKNPLGIVSDSPEQHAGREDKLLFFGDSFVAGVTSMSTRIPQVLDALLPEHDVLNFGVSGYGVDQIYLRFADLSERFQQPTVLIGILIDDLDRSALTFRTAQKPYFDPSNGGLTLRNTPILANTADYLDQHPPSIRSYLWRFIAFRLKELLPESTFDALMGFEGEDTRMRTINERLIAEIAATAAMQNSALGFVIFYSGEEIGTEDWRADFLRDALARTGLPVFDTKPFLKTLMDTKQLSVAELYTDDFGHLNAQGNTAVAQALARWLNATGLIDAALTAEERR